MDGGQKDNDDLEFERVKFQVDKNSWKPFLRQLLVCSGVWTSYFVYGLCIGSPTVFIPQIRREANSTKAISDDMASWLASAYYFSAFPCVIIVSFLTRIFGRKISYIIANVDCFIAILILYSSTSVNQILLSEIIIGLFSAAQIIVSVVIITEYTSPKYRGVFLTFNYATLYWGMWIANIIGTFFHWKNICLLAIICIVYMLITIFTWPESPYWLASGERYKECRESHRWLKGCDNESEKELETLINTQKEYLIQSKPEKLTKLATIRIWYVTVTSKEFYKPTLISMLTGTLSIISGKLVCTVYALDIIKKITSNESTAYIGMLILDGITVASMFGSSLLSKYIKRRTLLLVASSVTVVFLLILSAYLYLIHLLFITENKYVSLCLLILYSTSVSFGPLVISISVYGELVPVRSRNLAMCIIALTAKFLLASIVKIAPYIFKTFALHGTFLFFAISSSVFIFLVYIYLPETKDKTLHEIAESLLGKRPNCRKSFIETRMPLVSEIRD